MHHSICFCIPVRNRANTISAAIESIATQWTHEVEVVVTDNASTDNTREIVMNLKTRYSWLRYWRWSRNVGVDANILKSIQLAKAEYCWLLGSDDIIADGAVKRVIAALDSGDVLLGGRRNFSRDMSVELSSELFLSGRLPATFDGRNSEDLCRYFASVGGLGGLFSYISALIVRRRLWAAHPTDVRLIGSHYVHMGKIYHMLNRGARLHCMNRHIVMNRTGNDSFRDALGYARRRKIDLGILDILLWNFADRLEVLDAARSVMRRCYLRVRVIISDRRSTLRVDGSNADADLRSAYLHAFRYDTMACATICLCWSVPRWALHLRRGHKNPGLVA